MTKRTEVFSLKGVTKKFRRFVAVEDVTLTVMPGEVVGFVGVNGAGKTTTINMLLGFTSPTVGAVSIFGEKITPSTAHRVHRRIGYAAGDMELPLHMTGRQYLDFVLAQSDKNHQKQLDSLTERFKPQLNKRIKTLSRGNKQKIALVAAFVTEPDLVVLDEPTSGLDPIMQDAFLDLVQRERTKGTTIFMSSHYLQEVAEVCTRVILMKNGRIVEDLTERRLREAGGKAVRIVTTGKAKAPQHGVKSLQQNHLNHSYETSFIFDGKMAELAQWVGWHDDVLDLEVNEHTLEAEFRKLYADAEEGEENEA